MNSRCPYHGAVPATFTCLGAVPRKPGCTARRFAHFRFGFGEVKARVLAKYRGSKTPTSTLLGNKNTKLDTLTKFVVSCTKRIPAWLCSCGCCRFTRHEIQSGVDTNTQSRTSARKVSNVSDISLIMKYKIFRHDYSHFELMTAS